MADQQLSTLVQRLSKRTREGKVLWEKTVNEGVFQAAFPGFTIHLSTRPTRLSNRAGLDYVLQIYNDAGELVEETSDVDLDETPATEMFRLMEDLYAMARRTVMGVDIAINTLLAELGDDNS
jgi:hypothetical protein